VRRKGERDFQFGPGRNRAVEVEKDSAGAYVLGLGVKLCGALQADNGGQAHVKAPHHPPFL